MKSRTEDYIMAVDAPDVFFQGNEARIMEVFRELKSPFVISAETNCMIKVQTPDGRQVVDILDAIPGRYKYINCGCWMGERQYAINLLSEAIRLYSGNPWRLTHNLYTPMAWLTYGMIDNALPPFAIDRDAHLFYSQMAPAHDDREIRDGKVWNKATNTCPPVIHFNGTAGANPPYGAYYEMVQQLFGF